MVSESLKLAKRFLGKKVRVTIDRPLGSLHPKHGFIYESNYGFIAGTNAPDGEELDAYYLNIDKPLIEADGICVAIVHRLKDDDDKLVVIPDGTTISDEEIKQATYFQEQWFDGQIIREG
jgi:inorganic pyrophosphatase